MSKSSWIWLWHWKELKPLRLLTNQNKRANKQNAVSQRRPSCLFFFFCLFFFLKLSKGSQYHQFADEGLDQEWIHKITVYILSDSPSLIRRRTYTVTLHNLPNRVSAGESKNDSSSRRQLHQDVRFKIFIEQIYFFTRHSPRPFSLHGKHTLKTPNAHNNNVLKCSHQIRFSRGWLGEGDTLAYSVA